ncbi:transcriptional regulator GutM [Streptococcus parauberis]|uniref:Glucitol operon activator protein (GutM) n=1 Tax=Streptococcus parauberis NCFD 2020 TaxID=873447 RepID=F1Z264_9STRE|nr:transcriptional regulator GutM [Streptococcus parauberis]EGE53924.1 glucitol operon activator protein (GutM) [Streptococcus parauberis NCFD 2020]
MNNMIILGLVMVIAYILQIIFGLKQLKNFNETYSELRKAGKVAIGKRSGKIKAGTIVMFAVDNSGKVLKAKRMQGVTIIAMFKDMPNYIGQDIHYLDHHNPLVRQENKLLQAAIKDAQELFLRTEAGSYEDVSKYGSAFDMNLHVKGLISRLKLQLINKRS